MNEGIQPVVRVVDDDPQVLHSTQWLLEGSGYEVVTYTDASAFEAGFDPAVPGCVVLDIRMPTKDGLTLFEEMREHDWDIPVIFLTGHGDVPQATRALLGGAFHFLEKPYNPRQLIETIQNALETDTAMRQAREARSETANRYQELTPRQRDVARHLAAGMSAKETAQRLEMSPKTVEVHRGHILKKMGVSTTVELVHLLQQIQVAFPER